MTNKILTHLVAFMLKDMLDEPEWINIIHTIMTHKVPLYLFYYSLLSSLSFKLQSQYD